MEHTSNLIKLHCVKYQEEMCAMRTNLPSHMNITIKVANMNCLINCITDSFINYYLKQKVQMGILYFFALFAG